MKKNIETFFYYLNYLNQEKKFFFQIFLIFIVLSFFHYKFFPYNNYRAEIIFSIKDSKIEDFFKTERLFKKGETAYFNGEKELYANEVKTVIQNYKKDMFYTLFTDKVKKIIFKYNKTARSLVFNYSNYYEFKIKYIIEISNINDLDKLRKILDNEIQLFSNEHLKKINAKLNLISTNIDKIHSHELEHNKIRIRVFNLIKKEDLFEIFGHNFDEYEMYIKEKIEIEEKNRNLKSLINYFTNHQKKFTNNYIDTYNLNYINYDIFYEKKDQKFLLRIFLYLFLSFFLTIIATMIKLSYKNYR